MNLNRALNSYTTVASLVLTHFVSTVSFGNEPVPSSILSLGDGTYFSSTALVVDKSKRIIQVWEKDGDQIVKRGEYKSDLGKKEGNKSHLGDHKTPEGVYFLEDMLEGPGLLFDEYGVRAFTTNYPNLFDKRDGKTGHGIWLHAIPESKGLERGSRGCVVVRNESILEISKYIKLQQTPIIILTHSQAEVRDNTKPEKLQKFLESWRMSWEAKDLANYMKHYDESFESLGMNLSQWEKYKKSLNEKYNSIAVQLSPPMAFSHEGRVIVRVLQDYKSDQHGDFGEKTLYLKEINGEFKIVAEEWKGVKQTDALLALIPAKARAGASSQSLQN